MTKRDSEQEFLTQIAGMFDSTNKQQLNNDYYNTLLAVLCHQACRSVLANYELETKIVDNFYKLIEQDKTLQEKLKDE